MLDLVLVKAKWDTRRQARFGEIHRGLVQCLYGDPKDGELCLFRTKPGESLVEVH